MRTVRSVVGVLACLVVAACSRETPTVSAPGTTLPADPSGRGPISTTGPSAEDIHEVRTFAVHSNRG